MSLCCSYIPDYFSITDILATEERIPCTVEVKVLGLGFLDISSDSDDLKEGTKFEFPIWLAHPLNTIQSPVVSIEVPKVYKENYREILEADACAVPLSKWNLYYYEVGMYLRNFNVRESDKITQSLVQSTIELSTTFKGIRQWKVVTSSSQPITK